MPRGRPKSDPAGVPETVDVHVGQRVRLRRTLLGMSQEKLGEALGITFQQVQKYEHGKNRISASRLHHIAHVLDVPIDFFFDDMATGTGVEPQPVSPHRTEAAPDVLTRRETLELLRAYDKINPHMRRRLVDLMRSLASETVPAAGNRKADDHDGAAA